MMDGNHVGRHGAEAGWSTAEREYRASGTKVTRMYETFQQSGDGEKGSTTKIDAPATTTGKAPEIRAHHRHRRSGGSGLELGDPGPIPRPSRDRNQHRISRHIKPWTRAHHGRASKRIILRFSSALFSQLFFTLRYDSSPLTTTRDQPRSNHMHQHTYTWPTPVFLSSLRKHGFRTVKWTNNDRAGPIYLHTFR